MTTVAYAFHGALVANTAQSVTVSSADGTIEVINRSGSAEIYFTVNGATATVAGNDTYPVPAAVTSYVVNNNAGSVTVSLISSGTPTFSVVGGQPR